MDIYSEVISNTAMSSNFINTLYVLIFLDYIQVSSGKWICNTAEIRDIVVSLSVVIASMSIQWNNSDNADNGL